MHGMIRRLIVVLALLAGLLAVSAALAAGPRLTVTSGAAFAVRGVSFQAREHVLVVVTTSRGERVSTWVRAGARGAFAARFATIEIEACEGYLVRATGDRGSRAILKLRPPECPAPLTP